MEQLSWRKGSTGQEFKLFLRPKLKGKVKYINKVEVFKEELSWIKTDSIREFATKAVSKLPDYFFTVAASSTGKYHPVYALGNGGLVRHTKAAAGIAHGLLEIEMYSNVYSQEQKDLIITSTILHDGLKHGTNGSNFTVATHPIEVAEWIGNDPDLRGMLTDEQFKILYGAISKHMGQWNTDYKSKKEILEKPKTAIEKFVHQADYLASRKYLEYNFGDNSYNPKPIKKEVPAESATSELDSVLHKVVEKCKEKITSGVERDAVYKVVQVATGESKNPNVIKELSVAQKLLKDLEELNV